MSDEKSRPPVAVFGTAKAEAGAGAEYNRQHRLRPSTFSGGLMKRKNLKPAFMRVRLPAIQKTGGAHQPGKGGQYRRNREKENFRRELKAEFNRD